MTRENQKKVVGYGKENHELFLVSLFFPRRTIRSWKLGANDEKFKRSSPLGNQ
jgi:hypothetical protein